VRKYQIEFWVEHPVAEIDWNGIYSTVYPVRIKTPSMSLRQGDSSQSNSHTLAVMRCVEVGITGSWELIEHVFEKAASSELSWPCIPEAWSLIPSRKADLLLLLHPKQSFFALRNLIVRKDGTSSNFGLKSISIVIIGIASTIQFKFYVIQSGKKKPPLVTEKKKHKPWWFISRRIASQAMRTPTTPTAGPNTPSSAHRSTRIWSFSGNIHR
jgi:hypothetical protein